MGRKPRVHFPGVELYGAPGMSRRIGSSENSVQSYRRRLIFFRHLRTLFARANCRAQPATEGVYCDECLFDVIDDMLEGDVIAAYQEGVITKEEYLFILEPTTAALTQADEERFNQIMREGGWL
jgi:hypothetical protein